MRGRVHISGGGWRRLWPALVIAAVAAAPVKAETAAGTRITNIASASFVLDGRPSTLPSNMVTTCVAETLNVLLQAARVSSGPAIGFSLKNAGNGPESFSLAIAINGKNGDFPIRIDADGNGDFDPAVDTVALETQMTPLVVSGGTLDLLILKNSATDDSADTLVITARSNTGTGTPGSSFANQGEGGCDAVVGANATATLSIPLDGSAAPATFVKSQQVQAADGSARPVSGATITYRLEVQTSASGVLRGAFVTDPLPSGCDYLPGSLRLDDVALSDGADSDAGTFDGTQVRIALGEVPQATLRVVTFQVKIR